MNRIVLASIALVAISCSVVRADDKSDMQTLQSASNEYQLTVSRDWKPADFHIANVQIGAENDKRVEYAEVIVEKIKDYVDSLPQYAQAKLDTMAGSLVNPVLSPGQSLKIRDRDAIRFELHGQLPNTSLKVAYLLTVIKYNKDYVQVVSWTIEPRFKDNLQELQSLPDGFSETDTAEK